LSLSSSKLSTQLQGMAPAPTFPPSGDAWAQAYKTYGLDAKTTLFAGPPAVTAATATLSTALAAAFAAGVVLASTAAAMATAFTAFWLTPPVVFAAGLPGTVTAVGGTAALQAGLISTLPANLALTKAQQFDAIAALLHTFTLTVVTTTPTIPTPTVGPIS